jgi:two-component system response regulator (stage 0 sporulation protein F)
VSSDSLADRKPVMRANESRPTCAGNETSTGGRIMKKDVDLANELNVLGMLDKAREIYSELGESPAISYVRSNYRLLSKIYHPDLNPNNKEKAAKMQQKINEVAHIINSLPDKELVEIIKNGNHKKPKDRWKVLVVEDEFGYQDTLRNIFTMEGFDVRVAIDGDTGYEVYRDFKPDLVLTDVLMPNVSGIDLVRRIRQDDPSIKVIYMSGFFGVKRLKKEMDDEVAQHQYPTLSKPFKVSYLLDIVKEYLGMN